MFKEMIDLAIEIAIETEVMGTDVNNTAICKKRLKFIDLARANKIIGSIDIVSYDHAPSDMVIRMSITCNGIITRFGIFYGNQCCEA